mgnify:CR=1 FL=1
MRIQTRWEEEKREAVEEEKLKGDRTLRQELEDSRRKFEAEKENLRSEVGYANFKNKFL